MISYWNIFNFALSNGWREKFFSNGESEKLFLVPYYACQYFTHMPSKMFSDTKDDIPFFELPTEPYTELYSDSKWHMNREIYIDIILNILAYESKIKSIDIVKSAILSNFSMIQNIECGECKKCCENKIWNSYNPLSVDDILKITVCNNTEKYLAYIKNKNGYIYFIDQKDFEKCPFFLNKQCDIDLCKPYSCTKKISNIDDALILQCPQFYRKHNIQTHLPLVIAKNIAQKFNIHVLDYTEIDNSIYQKAEKFCVQNNIVYRKEEIDFFIDNNKGYIISDEKEKIKFNNFFIYLATIIEYLDNKKVINLIEKSNIICELSKNTIKYTRLLHIFSILIELDFKYNTRYTDNMLQIIQENKINDLYEKEICIEDLYTDAIFYIVRKYKDKLSFYKENKDILFHIFDYFIESIAFVPKQFRICEIKKNTIILDTNNIH